MDSSYKKTNTRRWFMRSCVATAFVPLFAYKTFAQGILRGAGEIRKLSLVRPDTGERIYVIYWIDGNYIAEAIEDLSYFCRDVATNTVQAVDPRVIDIAAATLNLLDTNEPYTLHRGFVLDRFQVRDGHFSEAQPNDLHHARGEALDVSLSSRSINQISAAAIRCNAGGVGSYPTRQYVHIDCGEVRNWSW